MSATTSPAAPEAAAVPAEPARTWQHRFLFDVLLRFAMVWILIVLAIVSDILYPGFFDWGNIKNILSQNAPVGVVAIGMTFVIIGGGFDLSVASIFSGGAVLYASWGNHMPLEVAFLLTCLAGIAAGAINGLIITKLRVNPFIATLGTASLFGGGALLYSHQAPIASTNSAFTKFGSDSIAGLPIIVWVLAIGFLLFGFILARTIYGRWVYAVGGGTEASRLAGLPVDLIRGSTYLLTGLGAAIGGMMIASRTGVGQGELDPGITLDSIAIVIIGGTSLLGGEGAMWRTLVGLLILGTINNLLVSMGMDSAAQEVVKGGVVLAAVAIDSFSRRVRG
jgi:ribose transport system permease protein